MPYTDDQPSLPYSGKTPTSRHTSSKAAHAASHTRAVKSLKYLQWLRGVGEATDWQASDALGWPLSSICSIRNGLFDRGKIAVAGTTSGRYGKDVTLWKAR